MRPVDQRLSTPDNQVGDCFSACIASILEIPLEDVPVFSLPPYTDAGARWTLAVDDWLRMRGYCLVGFEEDANVVGGIPCFHIISGPYIDTPKESRHAVVAYGDRIIHDPNSRRRGTNIYPITHRWLLVPTDWLHVKTPVPAPRRGPYVWWRDAVFVTVCVAAVMLWIAGCVILALRH